MQKEREAAKKKLKPNQKIVDLYDTNGNYKGYSVKPKPSAKKCQVMIVWGHGTHVDKYINDDIEKYYNGGSSGFLPIGCFAKAVPAPWNVDDAPDVSTGKTGRGENCYNGGHNAGGVGPQWNNAADAKKRRKSPRKGTRIDGAIAKKGFQDLVTEALRVAKAQAEKYCARKCKKTTVVFKGIKDRHGKSGNRELKKRGVKNCYNEKTWTYDCTTKSWTESKQK